MAARKMPETCQTISRLIGTRTNIGQRPGRRGVEPASRFGELDCGLCGGGVGGFGVLIAGPTMSCVRITGDCYLRDDSRWGDKEKGRQGDSFGMLILPCLPFSLFPCLISFVPAVITTGRLGDYRPEY